MAEILSAFQTNYGKQILPISRLTLFSPDEWERFIEEWVDVKSTQYIDVDHLGGAGDKGRDVVAYVTDKKQDNYVWDCYQCKHYSDPLTPSDIYTEIGKILYYSFLNEYPVPRAYYFVSPKGCGTSLSKMLQNKIALKEEMRKAWDNHCKTKISEKVIIELASDLLEYFEQFDFSIFDKVPPKKIIDEHKAHPNHIVTFGGGLPPRRILSEDEIPQDIQSIESVYISQLLLAYGSDCSTDFSNFESLPIGSMYTKHFTKTRINFHHAEQLRNFSRDNLPRGVFENFQSQVFDGIENILTDNQDNGFVKMKSAENQASIITISGNPLWDSSQVKDRIGICHQLSNDGKIKWL